MDGKWSDKEIQQLADKLAQEFRDIDPHLLFKALPTMFSHFIDEGTIAFAKGDKKRGDYFACLAQAILHLGRFLVQTGTVVMDAQDKSDYYNAVRKSIGGLN